MGQGSLNVGVIGCGYWGPNLVRNLFENRLTGKVVVSDLVQSKLQKIALRYPAVQVTTDAGELIERLERAKSLAEEAREKAESLREEQEMERKKREFEHNLAATAVDGG